MEDYESAMLGEHRWWSAEEIAGSEEAFSPGRLGELLPPILDGRLPAEPFDAGP